LPTQPSNAVANTIANTTSNAVACIPMSGPAPRRIFIPKKIRMEEFNIKNRKEILIGQL
jgi:hypothetical protein